MTVLSKAPVGAQKQVKDSSAPGRARPRARKKFGMQSGTGLLLVAPFMAVFVVFTAIPVIAAGLAGFTDIRAADVRNPLSVDFVGLDTYSALFASPSFLRSLINTFLYVVIGVPVTIVIGFLLALALDRALRRLRKVFRAAFFIPVTANVVAAAVIWQYAFTTSGPVNETLAWFGVDGPSWLHSPPTAFFAVVLLGIWRNIGMCMVLFLAGLQTIPDDVREAAAIDGAGKLRTTISIIVPLLRHTTTLVCVLMTIFFLNTFEEPYLVTGGGPTGSTRSMAQWIYEQFGYGNIAQSMAASILLLVVVIIIVVVQMRIMRPKH